MADYYRLLGVSKNDSIEKIKKGFYKLAHKHHPDKGGNPIDFIQIQEAYQTLTDVKKREEYDRYHHVDSFIQYGQLSDEEVIRPVQKKQRVVVVEYDYKRQGYTYKGNKLRYDTESRTWRLGDELPPGATPLK